ncbi:hypothetical protein N7492_008691 [Penicillium capsulatum]|uniref:Uncharacterized protein n=1 Tax=Penicillium capsulatum TaxID=69766 RepID=A0A9W9HQ70_9EURO|nr:hypothetical protein N7492_008691 [Penicillium capsulatum]KAJ6106095.1 hypothetical protein N7512_009612 [Penicillium capsulatum]
MPILHLVGDLKHCHDTKELTPGEAYVARFKNPCNGYRTDLWMAIILRANSQPGNRLYGRPKGAKPESGSWNTPLSERVYPVYLPGRNTYRYLAVHDLFVLEANVPLLFSQGSKHEGAAIFRDLHRIAQKNPGLEFWEQMADKETQAKGRRGRELSLVLPDDFDHVLGNITDPENTKDEDDRVFSPSLTQVEAVASDTKPPRAALTKTPPVMSQPLSSSETKDDSAATTAIPLGFPGESSSFLSYVRGQSLAVESSLIDHQLRETFGTLKSSGEIQIKIEDGSIPLTEEEKDSVFDISLRQALENIFLEKPGSVELLAIFTDTVAVQKRPESQQIQSFLKTGEFVPRLVQVNHPSRILSGPDGKSSANEAKEAQVGDCYGFGRRYQLEGVNNSDDLCKHILALGRLYQQARRFGLGALTGMITLKLQVAWNSYPGLCQLEPLLGVVEMAFKDKISDTQDNLQAWLIKFVADILDLIYYSYSNQFWKVMNGNPPLQRILFEHRLKLVQVAPEKYTDPRVLLRMRGIGQI